MNYYILESEYETLMIESGGSKYVDMAAWRMVMGDADPELCEQVEQVDWDFIVFYNLVEFR